MKLVVIMPFIVATGVIAPCTLGKEAGIPELKHDTAKPADRDLVVTELLRRFLKDVSTPETARKRFTGAVTSLHVRVDGGAHVNLGDFASDSFRLKPASGNELGRGGCIDEETRQPCALIVLSVISLDGDAATASVSWMQSPLSGAGFEYQLKKAAGSWQIGGIVGVFSS